MEFWPAVNVRLRLKSREEIFMTTEFDEWALIELMGHQRIAGRISEHQLGGNSFIRVDVPTTESAPAFTKIFNADAIYAITITDQITAIAAASTYHTVPMDTWSIKDAFKQLTLEPKNGDPPF
jgi:hypothetical protein